MLHAAIKADKQPTLRLGERRVLGPIGKQLAEPIAAARHNQQIEPGRQRGDLVILDAAVFDIAAAIEKILHQQRQINPVIDGAAMLGKIAAEMQRLGKIEEMVVIIIILLRVGPMIDAEMSFPLDGRIMVADGVEQPGVAELMRFAVGDDGGVDAVLMQVKTEMEAGDAAPTIPISRFIVFPPNGSCAQVTDRLDAKLRNEQDMIYS